LKHGCKGEGCVATSREELRGIGMGDKIAMLIAVTMIPSFANSTRSRDFKYLSSAASRL